MDSMENSQIPNTSTTVAASGIKPVWCPGCGDYGIQAAIMKALTDLKIDRNNVVMVSGIGCSSNMPHAFNTYGIHSLHGRLLPVASGVKLANSDLTVIGIGGDGDGYGIGGNHLVHTSRRNIDLTYIVINNEIYGLTTGQASPTSLIGAKTKSTPFGSVEYPLNPLALAISAGATYVARGFAGNPQQLAELIKGGITHKGFALIDVLSSCVSFNNLNTYDWFRQRIYKLEDEKHDFTNISKALEKAMEDLATGYKRVPTGLFYNTERPTFESMNLALKDKPALIKQTLPTKEQVTALLDENR
jgi:2-oxoglutarate ferredoxin oxidoreductase subunit beta